MFEEDGGLSAIPYMAAIPPISAAAAILPSPPPFPICAAAIPPISVAATISVALGVDAGRNLTSLIGK